MSYKSEDPLEPEGGAGSSTSNRINGQAGLAMQISGNVSGGITINSAESAAVSPISGGALPVPARAVVPRPELFGELLAELRRAGRSGGMPLIGVTGSSGFGKTTLVAAACGDDGLRKSFPGGVLWATAGHDAGGPELAARANELSQQLSGSRPSFTDAVAAGAHLGRLLGEKRCLLVIDDVCRSAQLEPFLMGGGSCCRLVITRVPDVLPARAGRVAVGAMQPGQARAALREGWRSHHPNQAESLLARTQSWPMLLALANGAVQHLAREHSPSEAVRAVEDRIARGPETLDRTKVEQRCDTATAMVELSLSLLSAEHRRRCLELAIFPGNASIPLETLRTYWGRAAGMSAEKAEILLEQLEQLALVQRWWTGDDPAVRVHEVVGDCLRQLVGPDLAECHRAFLDAVAWTSAGGQDAGWELPDSDPYLRRQGSFHQRAAGPFRPAGGRAPIPSPLAREAAGGRKADRRGWWAVLGTTAAVVLTAGAVALAAGAVGPVDRGQTSAPPVRPLSPPALITSPSPVPPPAQEPEPVPEPPPATSREAVPPASPEDEPWQEPPPVEVRLRSDTIDECASAPGDYGSPDRAGELRQVDCASTKSFNRWSLTRPHEDQQDLVMFSYIGHPADRDDNRCFDLPDFGSNRPGTTIKLADCRSVKTDNQLWQEEPVRPGHFRYREIASGNCLAAQRTGEDSALLIEDCGDSNTVWNKELL